jgi:hypothetical protein
MLMALVLYQWKCQGEAFLGALRLRVARAQVGVKAVAIGAEPGMVLLGPGSQNGFEGDVLCTVGCERVSVLAVSSWVGTGAREHMLSIVKPSSLKRRGQGGRPAWLWLLLAGCSVC